MNKKKKKKSEGTYYVDFSLDTPHQFTVITGLN